MDRLIIELLRRHIDKTIGENRNGKIVLPIYNIFITWKCKVLQNYKYFLCTDLPDDKYYELTYNGDKKELYIDEYNKVNNVAIDITNYTN